MKNLYLINATNEPSLTASFTAAAKKNKVAIHTFKSRDVSFFYDRKKQRISMCTNKTSLKLDKQSYYLLRRWGPNKSSSTLLSIILNSLRIPHLDNEIHPYQDVRSSKIGQTFLAPEYNVAFPSTWIFTRENISKNIDLALKTFKFPVVLKTQGAGRGRHVWKCNSKTELLKRIRTAKKTFDRDLYAVQEYIPNQSDIRVVVFEGKIITTIERSSNNGFYNNISQGGSGRVITLTPEEKGIAKRAAKLAKFDLAGVDIVRTKHGPLLFEVNKAPDLKCFNDIVGYDIATELAARIIKKY